MFLPESFFKYHFLSWAQIKVEIFFSAIPNKEPRPSQPKNLRSISAKRRQAICSQDKGVHPTLDGSM
jgi:hypothetical protein